MPAGIARSTRQLAAVPDEVAWGRDHRRVASGPRESCNADGGAGDLDAAGVGGAAHGVRVVTASGGFGDADSLLRIVDRLRCPRKETP